MSALPLQSLGPPPLHTSQTQSHLNVPHPLCILRGNSIRISTKVNFQLLQRLVLRLQHTKPQKLKSEVVVKDAGCIRSQILRNVFWGED
jgi:hypothetical protein